MFDFYSKLADRFCTLYWQKHAWGTKAGLRYDANVQDDNAIRFVHIDK